jgi:hypothetical protein
MLASSRGITGSNMDGKNIKSRNTDKCQNRGITYNISIIRYIYIYTYRYISRYLDIFIYLDISRVVSKVLCLCLACS